MFFQLALCFLTSRLWAGGSGYNVLIVVNQNTTNSLQLGNYYRAQRNIPPQNFLRINWPGTNTEWTYTDFTNTLLTPLLTYLTNQQLTNQIDYVVLSMDIPYRISNGTNGDNSTTSTLFYGFKHAPNQVDPNGFYCDIPDGTTNLYAGSEGIFRATPPASGGSNFFLVTMITASNLTAAEMPVQQGVMSDGTFPVQIVWLGKSSDVARNVRFSEFDNAVFNTRLRGNYSVIRTNLDQPLFPGLILGYQNGIYDYSPSPIPLFIPGAMADNLTSFGGEIFENSGQTSLLAFLSAGAAGSYGTVVEPCNYTDKFPDPQNYFYQSRGFSLAECYYQSLVVPHEGLLVGEPLAAPFAQPGAGAWSGLAGNAVLAGVTNLTVQFTASDALHPLQQVDLFLDGTFIQTVTNIPPQSGNVLSVSLNGFATSNIVSAGATVQSVASNLVNTLNGSIYQNETHVNAIPHGDRIELQSTAAYTTTGAQIAVSVSSTNPSGPLTTFIRASTTNPSNFLDSIADGINTYTATNSNVSPTNTLSLSVTKTNNAMVNLSVTNASGATFTEFAQDFLTAINNTAALQGPDGLTGGDLQTDPTGTLVQFDLQANSGGFAAAQIQAVVGSSPEIVVDPPGPNTLTGNLTDLEPRNHLYITAGATNLAITIPFSTSNFPNGCHELAAVAYEGSNVRTQTRATQEIIISNAPLSAILAPLLTGTNSALQPSLQITVTANTNDISSIQLFSTGGLLATVSNQMRATFTIDFTLLGLGTHPFYALVTDTAGHQYRTQTQTVCLIGVDYGGATLVGVDLGFPLQVTAPPPLLIWPATAGRGYTVLGTTNLLSPFQARATVIPTNSLGQWMETNTSAAQQFYRVSVTP